jgi:hypothetical protein
MENDFVDGSFVVKFISCPMALPIKEATFHSMVVTVETDFSKNGSIHHCNNSFNHLNLEKAKEA